jgi:acetylornithine deacetylase/succinyl-diaminopimelate desuccinylase-like protein
VFRDGKLYGRGGADDGYAFFSSLLAIRLLQEQGVPHATCSILIEGSEESGSVDLPAYVDHLAGRLGEPDLVVCLDAECGNYEQFWLTTSLRGNLTGTLSVEVLTEGVHSGMGTGIAASPFRILRGLLRPPRKRPQRRPRPRVTARRDACAPRAGSARRRRRLG